MRLRGQEYRRHLLAAAALHDIFTVGDLASAVGVAPGTVQGWWRGAKPKAENLPAIARALGFSTEALFAWFYEDARAPRLADPDEEARERSRHAPRDDAESAGPLARRESAGSDR